MAQKINNIHDKFIKELLADKDVAISFLEAYLPAELLDILELPSIQYLNTSYVSANLAESFSDIVWQFRTHGHTSVKVCLLLEHKSYKDEQVVFQILEYLALGYQQQLKQKQALALIVPVLYYHGQEKWELKNLNTYFADYPKVMQVYLPAFKTEFINLNVLNAKEINTLQNGMLRSALLIQRHYFDAEQIIQNIDKIVQSLGPYLEKNLSNSIFVYLIRFLDIEKTDLITKLENIPTDLNTKIMSLYDQLIAEGKEKGKLEGIKEEAEKVIVNAFKNQIPLETIRIITGETMETINTILSKEGLL